MAYRWMPRDLERALVAKAVARLAVMALAGASLAGCNATTDGRNLRASQPIPAETVSLMSAKGTSAHAPMLIRSYKKEAEFEIWKMKGDGKYTLLKTFPMCRWSGQLGPKRVEGDRQVPEGFYAITPGQMNPNSNYYLSFNVGYPNAYDRAHGYSGGSIMVHGACSSAGCFSMTDKQIAEIYAITRESFGGGQRSIQMQSFPFRMTAENFAKHRLDPNIAFWRDLKKGADYFEVAKEEPPVGLCNAKYSFGSSGCGGASGQIASAIAEKERADNARIAELTPEVKPVRLMYADGGQHKDFSAFAGHEISRPDALAAGPTEIEMNDHKVAAKSKLVAVAAAKAVAKESAAKETAKANPVESANSTIAAHHPAPAKGHADKKQISHKDVTGSTVAAKSESAQEPQSAPQASGSLLSRMWGSKERAAQTDEAASSSSETSEAEPVATRLPTSKDAKHRAAPTKPHASLASPIVASPTLASTSPSVAAADLSAKASSNGF